MTNVRGTLRTLGVLAALTMCVVPADAEPDSQPRPWAIGVSDTEQTRANELFAKGNQLLDQGLFAPALDQYQLAIAIWDHPAIRYNVAVALINLERPIEAFQELERALRFGADALEPDLHQQALSYQRLLRAQIVRLTVECVDVETRISLDGGDLSVPCPGSLSMLIQPGRHKLVAAKAGYLTLPLDLAPSGGEAPHVRIDLKTIAEATVHRRRWAQWKPWAVVGAGAVVGLVGLGFQLQSAATYRSYDRAVAALCPDRPCDALPGVITAANSDARRDNQVAIGAFAAASAVVVTGAVLVWLNRSVSESIGYDHIPIPMASVGRGESTIGARISF